MLVNVHAFLPRLFQLLEDALSAVDLFGFAFQFHPAFAGRDLHAERIFERFQEFEIVRVERLDGRVRSQTAACGFQSFRREPNGGADDTAGARSVKPRSEGACRRSRILAESVNKRPVGPFFRRLLDLDDDEIAAGAFRDDVCGGEMAFLPAVGLLHQFAFRIVNMDGDLGRLDFASRAKTNIRFP